MENVLDWTRSVLVTTPIRWETMAQNLPVELLTRRPAAGEWSALECLQHILETEEVNNARVGFFRTGQDFPDFNPDKEDSQAGSVPSPLEMSAQLRRMRKDSLALLATITPDELKLRARHSRLGMVSLGELIHNWGAHDFNHTVQAERAIMQPFILGCGPWQVYYQDHLVKLA